MEFGAAIFGFVTVFVVKLLVMILTGRLLVRLYRTTRPKAPGKQWLTVPEDQRQRFQTLIWGLVFFAVSEIICGLEIYILRQSHLFLACIHSVTSALAMGLAAIGLFQLLDWKFFHLIDRSAPCLAAKACDSCTKRMGESCQFRSLLLLTALLLVCLSVPVLFASTERLDANPRLYMLPFESWNNWFDATLAPWLNAQSPSRTDEAPFFIPSGMFVLEYRILPIAGMALAVLSAMSLLGKNEDRGIRLLLFSLGVFSYVYFEILIYNLKRDVYFGAFIHETGELIFLIMLSSFLLRVFPRSQTERDDHGNLSDPRTQTA